MIHPQTNRRTMGSAKICINRGDEWIFWLDFDCCKLLNESAEF